MCKVQQLNKQVGRQLFFWYSPIIGTIQKYLIIHVSLNIELMFYFKLFFYQSTNIINSSIKFRLTLYGITFLFSRPYETTIVCVLKFNHSFLSHILLSCWTASHAYPYRYMHTHP